MMEIKSKACYNFDTFFILCKFFFTMLKMIRTLVRVMQEQNQNYFRFYIFKFLYLSNRRLDNCRPLFKQGLDLRLDRGQYLSLIRISFGMLLSLSLYFPVQALYKILIYLYLGIFFFQLFICLYKRCLFIYLLFTYWIRL